nr:hypothetical protein [Rhodoplanes roseus]
MAISQKRKNIAELHGSAIKRGLAHLLEVSTKSESELGRRLSAFSLMFSVLGKTASVESIYQGSKVFESGGPYTDLYFKTSREAQGDNRLRMSGNLIRFEFEDKHYPLTPPTAFYDWLYLNALYRDSELKECILEFNGFTDIAFNPNKSLNCQARSCATFVALTKRGQIDDAVESFEFFTDTLKHASL